MKIPIVSHHAHEVEALVIALDFIGIPRLPRVFRRDECGILAFSRRLDFRGRRSAGAHTRTHLRRLEYLVALGAGDWRLMDVEKFGATVDADMLRTKF
jgi:hypothetical protein